VPRRGRFRLATLVVFAALFGAAFPLGGHVRADDALLPAYEQFVAGDMLAATDTAEAVGTAEALAFATQILCYHGQFVASEEERQPYFERAVALAERAVEMAPDKAEPHFQLAHALGRYAQAFGILEALSEGFADQVRDQIDAGMAIAPDDPTGHVLLGSWHAEIVASAGFMGSMIYGADSDEVFVHFDEAIATQPDDPISRLSYAEAILKLDDEDYDAEVRAQLGAIMSAEPRHALDGLVKAEAERLLKELDAPED
jgi:hypothetical protein